MSGLASLHELLIRITHGDYAATPLSPAEAASLLEEGCEIHYWQRRESAASLKKTSGRIKKIFSTCRALHAGIGDLGDQLYK